MEFKKVESSNIKEVAFNNDKLYVTFNGGGTYAYDSSEDEFKRFLESESKGKFFHTNLKGKSFEKITPEKLQEIISQNNI